MIYLDSNELKRHLEIVAHERKQQKEAEIEIEKDECKVRIKQQVIYQSQKIEEKDQQIAELEKQIKEKDQQIVELKKQIKKWKAMNKTPPILAQFKQHYEI